MTDLHTHILPGMDDGARDVETSLAMLRMEMEQGMGTVVLSPHFYPFRESVESFLDRRAKALELLYAGIERIAPGEGDALPRLVPAAEVAWSPALAGMPRIRELCIGSSSNILLELPLGNWERGLPSRIYEFMERTGLNPVLVHLERYMGSHPKDMINDILSLGLPVQLSADAMLGGLLQRSKAKKALDTWAHFMASDCHDLRSRRPCMGDAMATAEKLLGREAVVAMERRASGLIY